MRHYTSISSDVRWLLLHVIYPPSFEWWFGIWGFVMLLITVVQTAHQLYKVWDSLVHLLRRLETTRMKHAFELIGTDDGIHIKLWELGKPQLRLTEMALIVESFRRERLPEAAAAQSALADYQNADLEQRQPTQDEGDRLNEALNIRMEDALKQLNDVHGRPELDRYLALRITTFIRYVLLQMRNLMWFVIYGYFLAVVSVTFYPFQGGKNLSDMLAVTFVIVLVLMAVLVTQVMRNPMLKRLEDRESNSASVIQATLHLLSVGGLPFVALLAWQFPWIGQVAFSWLRPLLGAVR